MFTIYLGTLYDEIQASQFTLLFQKYHFELKYARYDFSPHDYDANKLIFQSVSYKCNLLFVYPGGTVDIYLGPSSAHFGGNEWIRIDYLASFLTQSSVTTWHSGNSHLPKLIIRNVLAKLYEIFSPIADQAFSLFLRDDYQEHIGKAKKYVVASLQQKE